VLFPRYCFPVILAVACVACTAGPRATPNAAGGTAPGTDASVGGAAAPESIPEWQIKWDETVAAARREGKVVVNGPPGDLVRKHLVDGFKRAFPDITLEYAGGRTAEQAAKVEAERRAELYALDVLIGARPALILPEVTDPSRWIANRLDFSDQDEFNPVFAVTPKTQLLYDLKQVTADEVDELYELLAPRWQGKIVVSDPTFQGTGQATFRWLWEVLGPEKATEFTRALRAQAGAVDRDVRRQIEWIARGRYAILVGPSPGVWQQLRQEGMQFGVLVDFKDYGTSITPAFSSLMLLSKAPHPNAQKVFVNWLLSKDGQTAYSTAVEQPSLRLDVPTDHLPPEVVIRPDGKYAPSYYEHQVAVPAPLASLLQEQYGR
jgi:iron(III) transport system substrate-binding protein